MITIWVPKRLVEVGLYNVAARSPAELAALSEQSYRERVRYAAEKVRFSGTKIVMLTGPSASGKTTSAHKLAEELERQGTPARVVSLDNFFRGAQYYPRLPDGTLDYENPDTLDLPLIRQCLKELNETGKTMLPVYDFSKEARSSETEEIDLKGGVCIVEGIHALNPELTSLVPGDQIYRVYAGLREEYCIDGRRTINTQDIRLCRRTLRDAATRGRSPAKTLAMWDRVMDGETRYIKGFKTTADFLLDTSFTYELGLIAKLLQKVRQQFTLEGHNAELWDETARRTLRDAATRGRSPAKTLAMWDRVMDGETRYIKGFKTTADFLLDTSFTYELGLIAKLLQKVRQQFTLEGHNAELWDETARRFEHVAPVALDLLPADSMLREFYAGEIGGKTAQ